MNYLHQKCTTCGFQQLSCVCIKIDEQTVRGADYYGDWFVDELIANFNLGFRLGNCVKYLLRAGNKPDQSRIKDYYKALSYLKRRIQVEGPRHRFLAIPENHVSWVDKANKKFRLDSNIYKCLRIICGFERGTNLDYAVHSLNQAILQEEKKNESKKSSNS